MAGRATTRLRLTDEGHTGGVGASTAAGPEARRWWRTAALAAVVLGYSWIGGGFRSFTWSATASTAVGGLAILIFAWRCRHHRYAVPANWVGFTAWTAWLAVLAGWELWAYTGQPRSRYPTLSALADVVTDSQPGRSVALLAWVALGWWLARLRPMTAEAASRR